MPIKCIDSQKEIFQKVLAECRKYYRVHIRQYPKRKSTIPNGSAHLIARLIYLHVKDKNDLYHLQTSVLIHEFGHMLDHVGRMKGVSSYIPTDYELEERAWEKGIAYFLAMGLIPKGLEEFRDSCLRSHVQYSQVFMKRERRGKMNKF